MGGAPIVLLRNLREDWGHAIGPPSRESGSPNTRSKGPLGYAAARKLAVCDLTKPPPATILFLNDGTASPSPGASGDVASVVNSTAQRLRSSACHAMVARFAPEYAPRGNGRGSDLPGLSTVGRTTRVFRVAGVRGLGLWRSAQPASGRRLCAAAPPPARSGRSAQSRCGTAQDH
jgi:hypothetical protein